MSEVIHLPVKPKRKMLDVNAPKYYCRKCEGNAFSLALSGDVTCSTCAAWMCNLTVQPR